MPKTCVLVADRARARLFVTAAGAERFGAATSLNLRELEALTDVEVEPSNYDEHRERHREEHERRFAKRIAGAVRELLAREEAPKLVMAVEPHMLGLLRSQLNGSLHSTELVELAKDFSWHTSQHILEALTRHGAINGSERLAVDAT
jgi:protein required for attachment to host cells